jgi:hypothetical protein
MHGDLLSGEIIILELIVYEVDEVIDARDSLELYAPQDGTLEGDGEGLFYFFGAYYFGFEGVEEFEAGVAGDLVDEAGLVVEVEAVKRESVNV